MCSKTKSRYEIVVQTAPETDDVKFLPQRLDDSVNVVKVYVSRLSQRSK